MAKSRFRGITLAMPKTGTDAGHKARIYASLRGVKKAKWSLLTVTLMSLFWVRGRGIIFLCCVVRLWAIKHIRGVHIYVNSG